MLYFISFHTHLAQQAILFSFFFFLFALIA